MEKKVTWELPHVCPRCRRELERFEGPPVGDLALVTHGVLAEQIEEAVPSGYLEFTCGDCGTHYEGTFIYSVPQWNTHELVDGQLKLLQEPTLREPSRLVRLQTVR